MKKRLFVLLLTGAMSVGLAAYGSSGDEDSADTPAGEEITPMTDGIDELSAEGKTVEVGAVCIGGENNQGYTYDFVKAVEEATVQLAEQGITVEWSYKRNILEGSGCEDANIELTGDGCDITVSNSYGFEPSMLKVAPDRPKIGFIFCTNQAPAVDDLDDTHNAFTNTCKGRYLVDTAGDMKLRQVIDEDTTTAEETVTGYVTTFPFTEVISSYTAFYQGTKSMRPSVTMKVKYVSSWSDAPQETVVASALTDEDCVLISQHSNNTTPTTPVQDAGVFHCSYSSDMTGVVPEASLISCRVDWTLYFVYAISAVTDGESLDQDRTAGHADGFVKLTELSTVIAAPGIGEASGKAEADLVDGLRVFADPLSGHPAQNPDGEMRSIGEGEFLPESDLSQEDGLSAPQSYYVVDDTTEK